LVACEEKNDKEIKIQCKGEEQEKKKKNECTYRKEKKIKN